MNFTYTYYNNLRKYFKIMYRKIENIYREKIYIFNHYIIWLNASSIFKEKKRKINIVHTKLYYCYYTFRKNNLTSCLHIYHYWWNYCNVRLFGMRFHVLLSPATRKSLLSWYKFLLAYCVIDIIVHGTTQRVVFYVISQSENHDL